VTLAALIVLALYSLESVPAPLAGGAWLGLALIAWWRPLAVLALVAASLPLFHQPMQLGDSTLAPSELLLGALLPGSLVVFGRHLRLALRRWRLRESSVDIGSIASPSMLAAMALLALLCLTGFVLLAGVSDIDARAAGLREWRWTLVEPLMLLGFLVLHGRDNDARKLVAGGYAFGVLAVALWGIVEGFAGQGVSAGGVMRVAGPFPHPNAYALYLLRAVAAGAALLLLLAERRTWAWLMLGFVLAALGASFARSAVLGAAVAIIVLLPWMSRKLRYLLLAGSVAAALLALLVAGDRMIGTSGTDSLALRGDIWLSGLGMIRDRPLSGYGPDQFLYVYTPRYIEPAAWAERFTAHGHNLLIDAWVRIGILGCAVVMAAALFVGRWSGRIARGILPGDALAGAAAVGLAAALAQGMVDNGYFVHDLAMSAWLLVWLGFARTMNPSLRGAVPHEYPRHRGRWTRRFTSV
jgi:O-antigen ligase